MGKRRLAVSSPLCILLYVLIAVARPSGVNATDRDYPYIEMEGTVQDFQFHRHWRSYYWRDDFTMVIRDDEGKNHRVISREPTPWSGFRFGTTYTKLKVNWTKQPKVKVIGAIGMPCWSGLTEKASTRADYRR